jgi:predicted TIM-barrel fold metal-dependent hydrolase
MISRRHFIAASGATVLTSTTALASQDWRGSLFALGGKRVSVSETFTPPEWRQAIEASLGRSQNAVDRDFLRILAALPRGGTVAAADELQLLSLPAPGLEPVAPAEARQLAIITNDRLAQVVREGKGRVAGLASVSAFDCDAAREAERAVTKLGLAGVSLGANRGMRLTNRQLWPLYEFAQATGTPIYLPAAYSASAGDAPYRAMRREGIIAGASADSADHAAQLIFGGVLDAFPRLVVVLGRMGEAMPHWYGELAAAQAAYGGGDARAPQRQVREYFRTNLFLTTADMVSPATFEFCAATLGSGRVLRAGPGAEALVADNRAAALTRVTLDSLRRAPREA